MKSILQHDDNTCYICGRNGCSDKLHWHHIFGASNRKFSEKYGLKVRICGQRCHENGPEAVHKNNSVNLTLKAAGQKAFETIHGTRDEFRSIFGKNYL